MKRCKKCGEERNEVSFRKEGKGKRGDICNRCLYAYKKTDKYKEKKRLYQERYRQKHPLGDISGIIGSQFRAVLYAHSIELHVLTLLGVSSVDELLACIGPKPEGAHLDHICPISQAKSEEEVFLLWKKENLRWLDAKENLSKNRFKTPEAETKCRELLGREWIDK